MERRPDVPAPMETSVVDNRQAGRFELHVGSEVAGFLAYELAGDVVSFVGLETDLRRAGQGLGLVLVRRALDAAAGQGWSVLPEVAFVRDFIRRHPVYLDLVPADQQPRFEL